MGVLWGKLACEILLKEWSAANESVGRLRDAIERTKEPALQLTQRSWLVHWALFVFVGTNAGGHGEAALSRFLDLATSEVFLNAVQATAPHLLRYILLAAVTGNRAAVLRELVRVVEVEQQHLLQDPIGRFVHALFIEFDFDAALEQLARAKTVLAQDFFAASHAELFQTGARQLVFRSYCRVHSAIDLTLLSAKLGTTVAEAESYIVDLIRNEQDAKIDSASNQIVFAPQTVSYQQKLLEKTQALYTQTALLQAQLARSMK
jgi:translation initiation factor 3 subunit E